MVAGEIGASGAGTCPMAESLRLVATGWLVLYWFFASCMAEYTKQGDMLLVVWLKLGLSVSWGPRGCLARGCCCAHSFMLSAVLGET